jgi:NAD+ synthase
MDTKGIIKHIAKWLSDYSEKSSTLGFVVGISGGIDSAVTSTLCALTGKWVIALNMPIRQHAPEFDRSNEHINWLCSKYQNAEGQKVELTKIFDGIEESFPRDVQDALAMANTRARLRMLTLYAFATRYKLLVAGTGNKVEDFGVGFFTKYGDGGVDLSPIADLNKTQVYSLAAELGIVESIRQASPTDGLFPDSRSDEEQLGASYPELEWAMEYINRNEKYSLSSRQKHVLEIFRTRHQANKHKMEPIPVCHIPPRLLVP